MANILSISNILNSFSPHKSILPPIFHILLSLLYTWAAAAAAKSLQLCPTLCDPVDSSPPDSPVHGIFQARVLG